MIEEKKRRSAAFIKGFAVGIFCLILMWNTNVNSSSSVHWIYSELPFLPTDTPATFEDQKGSFVQENTDNKYILPAPKNVDRTVEYDYKTNSYKVTEKVNGQYVKPPMYLTYKEYLDMISDKEDADFLSSMNANKGGVLGSDGKAPVAIAKKPDQDIFGDGLIEIKPQGNVGITLGYTHNRIENPNISPFQQSQGLMNFDMNLNIGVTGKIGDKFQTGIKYNTQSNFGFEGQQVKLAYKGKEDEIIRNLEAGNVSFETPTQLISGAQSLFGLKSEFQFGKVNIKSVLSQQRSNLQSKTIQNGSEVQKFEITSDQYDVNKHFFLSQYFRNQYENSLKNLPTITSQFQVINCEVWVTNRGTNTTNVRDVVAFQDFGENQPYSKYIHGNATTPYPDNTANDLFGKIKTDQNVRDVVTAQNTLQTTYNLTPFQDFEKAYTRKLSASEYTLNTQLGFISLNTTLQPNDVLAVAFQYTVNGQLYQVGDLTRDITLPDTSSKDPGRVLFLKLLKGANLNPTFPVWDLMMKNVYSLNAYQVAKDNFRLDIYYNDPGGGAKRYMPQGNLQTEPLIRVMNLDRLNQNSEPYPDGVFDFVPNITINATNGKVFFPVLEPFGSHLKQALTVAGNASLASTYVYQQLYDSTQYIAQQYPQFNRFVLKGTYQSATSKRIQLGGFGIPQGSVKVSLNGQQLVEGQDYTIEYGLGYIELSDQVLAAGGTIKVDFENNSTFSLQQKNFTGARVEYRENDNLKFGTTYEKLSERPFNNKISYGDDPISNQMIGGDVTYNKSNKWLTRLLDKLPFYQTDEVSNIKLYGEYARLIPGHYSGIGQQGTIYVDDFESVSLSYTFGSPATSWRLASTPSGARDATNRILFPEATLHDNLQYGFNRAKLAWYNINQGFYFNNSSFPTLPTSTVYDVYQRIYNVKELFPNRNCTSLNCVEATFDLAYFPNQKGPYNYESSAAPTPGISQGINADNTLKSPTTRWAGIQRQIDNTNFENTNVEYIQFWVLDPFLKDKNNKGDLYINLGYISEDALKDSRMSYEHGLYPKDGPKKNLMATSHWATAPNLTPLIQAFDNDPTLRPYQDLGYDGYNDQEENDSFSTYMQNLRTALTPAAYTIATQDPSNDNFQFYLDQNLINSGADIIHLYKNFNNIQNNSPVNTSGTPQSNYSTPDNEDLNADNTLNENEAYFQYRIPLFPGMNVGNHPYIISTVDATEGGRPIPGGYTARWYQMRIPIKSYDNRVGQIGDFRNIQFVRMFVTNFQDSAVLRFAEMSFIRNSWRKYDKTMKGPIDYIPSDNNANEYFNVAGVGLEENGSKIPVNYVSPPNAIREVGVNSTANPIQLNEQALQMDFCGLKDGQAKATFKNIQFDFRQFKTLKIDFHAENHAGSTSVKSGDLNAFIRLGSDFTENYYEYEIPLEITPAGTYIPATANRVWPDSNEMVITLDDLVNLKYARNIQHASLTTPFVSHTGARNITVVGNPDLGLIKEAMIGVRNRATNDPYNFIANDDGLSKCGEVWANEMRLEGLNEEGGSAGLASVQVKMADLGNLNFTGQYHTVGFGQINQRVNERQQDDYTQYTVSTNLQLGKFFPKKWGVNIPFFWQNGQTVSRPKYDPYYLDIKTAMQHAAIAAAYGADSADKYDKSVETIQTVNGFNFTGVKIIPQSKNPRLSPFALRNFTVSYAYNSVRKSSPYVETDWVRNYMGEFQYSFASQPKYIEPFRKLIKSNNKNWDAIKSLNINLIPTSLGFSTRMDRQYGYYQQRQLSDETYKMDPQYLKTFTWKRNYTFAMNPIRPLTFNFQASNDARIDEPTGAIDSKEKRDSIWKNILKGGRTTKYTQTANASYNLPIQKIQYLDFITSSLTYNSGFNWTTGNQIIGTNGQLIQSPQGNIIDNAQSYGINTNFKMAKLYSKIEALKKIDVDGKNPYAGLDDKQRAQKIEQGNTQLKTLQEKLDKEEENLDKLKDQRKEIRHDTFDHKTKHLLIKKKRAEIKAERKKIKELKKQMRNVELPSSVLLKAVTQPLMAVRDLTFTYSVDNRTSVPGYTQKTGFLGVDYSQNTHLDQGFVFGAQPGIGIFSPPDKYAAMRWLEQAGNNGWITKDSTFNLAYTQTNSKKFGTKITLEPYKHLKINLTWTSQYDQNYSEIFKYDYVSQQFVHYNPMETGSYTYSDINLLSSFNGLRSTAANNQNINLFNENRATYAQIFQENNVNSYNMKYIDPITGKVASSYYYGYGPLQSDVVLNSFLTTYRGQKATTSSATSPFSRIPLPNWDINYTGLQTLKWFKKRFTQISLKHGYQSTTTLGSYTTDLRYGGDGTIKNPVKIDSVNNNFISYYYIPSISISESYNPLIGLDFTMKNALRFGFSIRSKRTVSMSLIDYLITENEANDLAMNCGFVLKHVKLPITNAGKKIKLENDVSVNIQFSMGDASIVTYKMGQDIQTVVGGQYRWSLTPTIDYKINDRVNMQIFYRHTYTRPKLSNSYPITNIAGGMTLNFSLAQ